MIYILSITCFHTPKYIFTPHPPNQWQNMSMQRIKSWKFPTWKIRGGIFRDTGFCIIQHFFIKGKRNYVCLCKHIFVISFFNFLLCSFFVFQIFPKKFDQGPLLQQQCMQLLFPETGTHLKRYDFAIKKERNQKGTTLCS